MIKVKAPEIQQVEILDNLGKSQVYNIDDQLAVNDSNYQQEYLMQARKYSFWADKLSVANRQVAGAEQQVELMHAKLYKKYFLELTNTKLRPTKDMVESDIVQDEEYQVVLNELNESKYIAEKLKFIVKAFEQRNIMLTQFGAEMRKDKEIGA